MRKLSVLAIVLCLLALPGLALADGPKNTTGGFTGPAGQGNAQGGYTGPTTIATIAVKDALNLRDDARVVLQGKIVQYLGDDRYLFSDATGSVTIEIDDDFNWQGQTVGPDDTVIIHGKVDRDFRDFEIEVKRLEKVPAVK